MCNGKGSDMSGRAVIPTAHAGESHVLAASSQTGVPVSDIVLPVVSYHSSAESFHPRSCWQKELSECSLACFQQVRRISQQREFKTTCSLCLKQTKVLSNKPFYQQSYSSSTYSIKGAACRCKLAKSSNGTVRSGTHHLSIVLQVHTSYSILHAHHLSMCVFYCAANTKSMQLH